LLCHDPDEMPPMLAGIAGGAKLKNETPTPDRPNVATFVPFDGGDADASGAP
jgi:hypothetical protein